jgi:hypothetical protein
MVDGDLEDGAPLHEACAAGRPGRASLEKSGLDPRAQMPEHAPLATLEQGWAPLARPVRKPLAE